MAWIGAAIAGAAAIGGDVMSQQGQQATNAAMLQQNKDIMSWETMMSDTAMSRRMLDLKSAGVNPMLAIGEGGASTPTVGAVPLQNPNASFGQLGQQASSAVGLFQQQQVNDANIAKTRAETEKLRATTPNPDIGPDGKVITDEKGQPVYNQSRTVATGQQQADEAVTWAQKQSLAAGIQNTNQDTEVKKAQVQLINSQTDIAGLEQGLKSLDLDQKRSLYPLIKETAERELPANISDADYRTWQNTSPWGRILKDFSSVFQGTAQGASHILR